MDNRTRSKWIFGAAAALGFGLLMAIIVQNGIFTRLHLQTANFLYSQTDSGDFDEIVLVAIDDRALELRSASEVGTLQFAKADYAKVLENLEEAGARAIGLDVILSEPSSEEDIAALIEVLQRYDDIVIASQGNGEGLLQPLPEFTEATPDQVASVQFSPDRDNTVRRQQIAFEDGNYSFIVKVIQAYLGLTGEEIKFDQVFKVSDETNRIGNNIIEPINIPVDEGQRFLLNFFGPPGSYPILSMADVMEGKFVDSKTGKEIDLQDKVVLIGEIGTALHDVQLVPTSVGQAMPGVEIHANGIQTILTSSFIAEQSESSAMFWALLIFAVSLILFLFLRLRYSLILFFVLLAGYTIITWVAFEFGTILHTIHPYFSIIIAFIAAYLYRYFVEERKARATKQAFGRYVSPHVVQEIVDNPTSLELGGEKRNITVFFSDIAGFTSISEKLGAEELVDQLNEYLEAMSEVILEEDGTIDKYIGDAIMAFWNAPTDQTDHAWRACKTALAYQKALDELNEKRIEKGEMEFGARVGLNTGDMIVGNMGSTKRFDYTVIGDAVNLGARLEGVNKVYGTKIMISEYTYEQAKDDVEVRELDLITVKGKEQPVRIFELQAMKGEGTEVQEKLRERFAEGLRLYRAQKWEEAKAAFQHVLSISPEDGPAKLFLQRCEDLRSEDLPADWDGVFKLKSK